MQTTHKSDTMYGTTILAVRKDGYVSMAGDGQVTLGHTVMKGNARKVRRLYKNQVVVGFAGATADAFTLLERFERKLTDSQGDVRRSAVDLAKEWRTDKILRNLEAMMLVAKDDTMLLISGNGDVIEPETDAIAIGSGGAYAYAAAKAYLDGATDLSTGEIATRSLAIAADICIYTNKSILLEETK